MRKIVVLSLILLSLITMLFAGCSVFFHVAGTGDVVEKTYSFKDFTNVEISDAVQYEVKQSDSYSVIVSTKENIVDHLDVYQSGNTLHIGFKFGFYSHDGTVVMVTLPQLNKLEVSGSCQGKATGFDSTGDLEINVSGASAVDMKIKAGQTGIDISGASKITGELTSTDTQIKLEGASHLNMSLKTGKIEMDVSGSSDVTGVLQALDSQFKISGASNCDMTGLAGYTLIEVTGSSDMNSPGLTLQSADVKLDGASHARIYTDGALDIVVSGSSTLDYSGNPTIGKIDISGASKINHK